MKEMGKWWNSKEINLVQIDERVYGLHGWNGEEYCNCFEVFGDYNLKSGVDLFTLRPIYKENADEDSITIGYEITKNQRFLSKIKQPLGYFFYVFFCFLCAVYL